MISFCGRNALRLRLRAAIVHDSLFPITVATMFISGIFRCEPI